LWIWLTIRCQSVVTGFADVQVALELVVHEVGTQGPGRHGGAWVGDVVVLEEAAVLGDDCPRGEAAWGSGSSACHVDSVYVRHLEDGRKGATCANVVK